MLRDYARIRAGRERGQTDAVAVKRLMEDALEEIERMEYFLAARAGTVRCSPGSPRAVDDCHSPSRRLHARRPLSRRRRATTSRKTKEPNLELASFVCECGSPFTAGAKFCSQCGRPRPASGSR